MEVDPLHILINLEVVLLESTTIPLACDSMSAHVLHLDLVPGLAAPRGVLNLVANIHANPLEIKHVVKRALQRQLRELQGPGARQTCRRVNRSPCHGAVLQRGALADGGAQS